ncbi:MAG: hypothetical protein JJU11_03780, partial [Candidatus Sumerlaeia bacterium]|nr:hypothetical protein [Candidatus Sumerlaeia bacterium]
REGAGSWTWSAQVSPAFLPNGTHPVAFYVEYPDGDTTKLSEMRTEQLRLNAEVGTEQPTGWITR